MITPAEIKLKALRVYPGYLSSLVTKTPFFPFDIRFGKKQPRGDFHDFDQQRATLFKASKKHSGTGYHIDLTPFVTRRYGEQLIPSRIFFESEYDYLSFIGKIEEVSTFKKMLDVTRSSLPQLIPWIENRPTDTLPYLDVWTDLLQVCHFFKKNPQPGCYIREIPLEVHTKFIETHSAVLRKMLDIILSAHYFDEHQSRFAPRFGLREADPLIRIRCLSPDVQTALNLGFEDLGIPISAISRLKFQGLTVVIVENLMTFLTLPASCGDVALFGKGFQAGLLKDATSLHKAELLYWGDLDSQGFMILSQLRSAFKNAQSVLMDQKTLEAHRNFTVQGTPCAVEHLPELTAEELAMFQYLSANQLRLEQERIPLAYIRMYWPNTS